MSTSPEIWTAFARTFFMLCVVLITLVLLFYFIKRFSKKHGVQGDGFISVLAVHYISPKEKILLLDVLNEKILIGVTSQMITQLATIDSDMEFTQKEKKKNMRFADFLSSKLMKNKDINILKDKE
jgi:flagellar protein FliO/FliZ